MFTYQSQIWTAATSSKHSGPAQIALKGKEISLLRHDASTT